MMKNIIVISNHGNMLGGGEYSFLDFVIRLAKHWNVLALIPYEGALSRKLRDADVATRIAPLAPLKPRQILNIFKNLKDYLILCHKYKADLIYANGSRAAFYGGMIGRLFRVPVIWHCRITEPDVYLDPILIRLCKRIIVNSFATSRRFRTRYRNKISVSYNGIDLTWFQDKHIQKPPLVQTNWKVILMVARVSKMKRHDLAIMAFEKFAQFNADVHFLFIGDSDPFHPEWRKQLQDRTQHSPVADRMHWINQVDDLRPWYQYADILVLTSENESFGRVLVEAMACGVPVVASRIGGIPEIVRDGQDGILFTPGNAEELADAMARIARDENFRQRLSASAKNRAGSFSLDRHVNHMLRIFKETLN